LGGALRFGPLRAKLANVGQQGGHIRGSLPLLAGVFAESEHRGIANPKPTVERDVLFACWAMPTMKQVHGCLRALPLLCEPSTLLVHQQL
jgi:hypothetical protein